MYLLKCDIHEICMLKAQNEKFFITMTMSIKME